MAIYLLTVCIIFLLFQIHVLHKRLSKLEQWHHTLVTATHDHGVALQESLTEHINKQLDILNTEMNKLHREVSDHVNTEMVATLKKVASVVGERTTSLVEITKALDKRIDNTVKILEIQDDQISALAHIFKHMALKVGIDLNTPIPKSNKTHAH